MQDWAGGAGTTLVSNVDLTPPRDCKSARLGWCKRQETGMWLLSGKGIREAESGGQAEQ